MEKELKDCKIEYNTKIIIWHKNRIISYAKFKDIPPIVRKNINKIFGRRLNFGNIDYFTEKIKKNKRRSK